MSNFKRKANHRTHKGCSLCDTHKRCGNSVEALKAKYREIKKTKIIFDTDQGD